MTPTTITPPQQLEAWVSFLRAHAAITRELSAQLQREHGLTLNDYEVLLHLSRAPDRRLRRVDLVDRVLLTASGITRLLDGLQSAGFVKKAAATSHEKGIRGEEYNKFWVDAPLRKIKPWNRTSLVIDPPDGRMPPFTPEMIKWIEEGEKVRYNLIALRSKCFESIRAN